ncbi:hotdog domain-containing protein [Ideonella sp. DXS22W]|uniref:Hotdog domain-containing protein n=1 Tax=Pseudaquabacterium inlustre TaxID=2984192 RepID=A0ABU9CE75_9BURK
MTSLLDDLNRKYVGRAPHMAAIGLEVTAVGPARGTMRLPDRPEWLGDAVRNVLHPGPLTVLADSACGLAVGAAMRERAPYATLDLRMDYLRPAAPGHALWCEAHCHRITASVGFVRGEVWHTDREAPLATVQATFMLSTPAGSRRAHEPMVSSAPAGGAVAEAPAWQAPADASAVQLGQPIPYVDYLGIRESLAGDERLYRLPFDEKLVGNPRLPALHGGVIAGFAETAATLQVIHTVGGAKQPKSIDFSIDYLRAGRPEETFARCEIVRLGARVALVQVRCWQKSPDVPIAVCRAHFLLSEPGAAG